MKKHPLSRLVHNFLVPYLLVESHTSLDLPWMSHRIFPAIFGGPVRHERHHIEVSRMPTARSDWQGSKVIGSPGQPHQESNLHEQSKLQYANKR